MLGYSDVDIDNIESSMNGDFVDFRTSLDLFRNELDGSNLDYTELNYNKSFMVKDVFENKGLLFVYLHYNNDDPVYFLQSSNVYIPVSEMARHAKLELENNDGSDVIIESKWGDCYRRVKAVFMKAIEEDGETLAICDGLNYLGLCDAAIATASAAICTRNSNAGKGLN